MTKCPICKQESIDEEHDCCIVCGHKFEKQRIVEFVKSKKGISVSVNNASSLEVIIGIAEIIQLIIKETKQSPKQILDDIKIALEILRKEEKDQNG